MVRKPPNFYFPSHRHCNLFPRQTERILFLTGGKCYLGTDLIREAREGGFKGFVAVRSANTEPNDVDKYMAAGADIILQKSMSSAVLASKISEAMTEVSKKEKLQKVDFSGSNISVSFGSSFF